MFLATSRICHFAATLLISLFVCFLAITHANDQAGANQRFVEANRLILRAKQMTSAPGELLHYIEGLPKAIAMIESIPRDFPASDLATKIITGAPIGNFSLYDLKRHYERNLPDVIHNYCYKQNNLDPPHCEGQYNPHTRRQIDDHGYETTRDRVLSLTDTAAKDASIRALITYIHTAPGGITLDERHALTAELLHHVHDTSQYGGNIERVAVWLAQNRRFEEAYALAARQPFESTETTRKVDATLAKQSRRIKNDPDPRYTSPEDYLALTATIRTPAIRDQMAHHYIKTQIMNRLNDRPDPAHALSLFTDDTHHDQTVKAIALRTARVNMLDYAFDILDLTRNPVEADRQRRVILTNLMQDGKYDKVRLYAPRLTDPEAAQQFISDASE